MAEFRVSAVITTYHREWECVQRAVESVLEQSVPVLELLLIDDNGRGSDLQKQIEKEAARYPRIRYISMEHNSGVSAARNCAIAAAQGEILGYLDDDDTWCADKVEKLLPLFTEYTDTALAFGTGRILGTKEGEESYNWQWEVFKPEPGYIDMLYTDYVGSASAPLIRTDVLRILDGFREEPAAEDYELWIRIAKDYRLRGIRDVVFHKRKEPGEHVSGSVRQVGYGFRSIYQHNYEDYQKYQRARTAMLWNICRTGVRGMDPTVVPYILAWLKSRAELRYLATENHGTVKGGEADEEM